MRVSSTRRAIVRFFVVAGPDLHDCGGTVVMKVGELVGRGRTSDVYAYGPRAVVKVPHRYVPNDWPAFEAAQTTAVRNCGAPAPVVLDITTIDGRSAIVFERVDGPSLWELMFAYPHEAESRVREFATIQKSLLRLSIPAGLPDFVDRLIRKIKSAPLLSDAERHEAITLTERMPRGAALLHGDLHPGNVLIGEKGPVVIDWFDASIGHPVADITRSAMLIHPGRVAELRHLPGASQEHLAEVYRCYRSEFKAEMDAVGDDEAIWLAIVAAGRLAEQAELNESGLLQLWAQRHDY